MRPGARPWRAHASTTGEPYFAKGPAVETTTRAPATMASIEAASPLSAVTMAARSPLAPREFFTARSFSFERPAIAMRSELRLDVALDFLHRGVAHRRRINAVDRGRTIERPTRPLECCDGVFEVRRGRVARDRIEFGEVSLHRALERQIERSGADFIERRHTAVRSAPRCEQRIGGCGSSGDGGEQRASHDGEQYLAHEDTKESGARRIAQNEPVAIR